MEDLSDSLLELNQQTFLFCFGSFETRSLIGQPGLKLAEDGLELLIFLPRVREKGINPTAIFLRAGALNTEFNDIRQTLYHLTHVPPSFNKHLKNKTLLP